MKQLLKGVSQTKMVLARNVSDGNIREIRDIYKNEDRDGLKDHKTGSP